MLLDDVPEADITAFLAREASASAISKPSSATVTPAVQPLSASTSVSTGSNHLAKYKAMRGLLPDEALRQKVSYV